MLILYDNHVFNATISSFTENPDYSFDTALKDTRLSRIGRTTDDDDQWLKFTFSAAVNVDYACILAHNISSGATVKIQANATDVWTSPSIDVAMTYNADYIIHAFSSTQSYQYWRIFIDDASNPDNYVSVGQVFLGEKLTMPGMDGAQVLPKKSNSVATKSISGQLYGDVRLKYKSAEVMFPLITETQRTAINKFFDTVDVVRPFILLIWENNLDVEPLIYCALTEELTWTKLAQSAVNWTLSLTFEECK